MMPFWVECFAYFIQVWFACIRVGLAMLGVMSRVVGRVCIRAGIRLKSSGDVITSKD